MEKQSRITEEVEKTLRILDDEITLAPNPFLSTKMAAAEAARLRNRASRTSVRTVLNYAAVLLLVALNLITAAYYSQRTAEFHLREQLISQLKKDVHLDQYQTNF